MRALVATSLIAVMSQVTTGAARDGVIWSPNHGHLPDRFAHLWCVRHIVDRDYELAVEDCKSAIARNPLSGEPHSNLAAAYILMKRPDDAIAEATIAIRLEPRQAVHHFNRGLAYDAKADWVRAIADYTSSIALAPYAPRGYYNRGMALRAAHKPDDALQDLMMAAALSGKSRQKSGHVPH